MMTEIPKGVMAINTEKYTFDRPEYFDLDQIFDCGQCFRFDRNETGGYDGIAFGMPVTLTRFSELLPTALIGYGGISSRLTTTIPVCGTIFRTDSETTGR